MRTLAIIVLALGTQLAARPARVAAQMVPEIVIAADASGRLVARPSDQQPFHVPPSRFLGLDGYADAGPSFRSLDPARQTPDLRPLEPGTPIAFELIYTDPGLTVLDDRGSAPLRRRDMFRLGVAPFAARPVWIMAGDVSLPRTVTLRLLDRAGGYEPSDAFRLTFVPDATVEAYLCPLRCEDQKSYAAPAICPVCGTRLALASTAHYRADVTSLHAPHAGEPAVLRIALRDPKGAPVVDLERVHERVLRLFVTSTDLSWFASADPTAQSDGSFSVPITFPAGGRYTLFHEFTPARVGRQVVAVDLDVVGAPAASVPLVPDASRVADVDGLAITFDTGGPLVARRESRLTFALAQAGRPVRDVEPFLGARAHLVLISEDRKHLVPNRLIAETPDAAAESFSFGCRFPAAGTYKARAEFRRQGRLVTASFVLHVQPAVSAVSGDE